MLPLYLPLCSRCCDIGKLRIESYQFSFHSFSMDAASLLPFTWWTKWLRLCMKYANRGGSNVKHHPLPKIDWCCWSAIPCSLGFLGVCLEVLRREYKNETVYMEGWWMLYIQIWACVSILSGCLFIWCRWITFTCTSLISCVRRPSFGSVLYV